jgi:hypothetical protein
MTNKSVENITCERTIPASPDEVFDAWLDPKIPGTPFHENEKLIVNPMVDGLWYWLLRGNLPKGKGSKNGKAPMSHLRFRGMSNKPSSLIVAAADSRGLLP